MIFKHDNINHVTLSSDAPAAALREAPYNNTNVIGDTVVIISIVGVISELVLVITFITFNELLIVWYSKLSTRDLNINGTCTFINFVAKSRLIDATTRGFTPFVVDNVDDDDDGVVVVVVVVVDDDDDDDSGGGDDGGHIVLKILINIL